jgi:hypothetical protein
LRDVHGCKSHARDNVAYNSIPTKRPEAPKKDWPHCCAP